MCSAGSLMVLYICLRFHENISNGFQLTEQTRVNLSNGFQLTEQTRVQYHKQYQLRSGQKYMAEMAMLNIQMVITPKAGKPELLFMCSASPLMVLYISVKFREKITKGIRVVVQQKKKKKQKKNWLNNNDVIISSSSPIPTLPKHTSQLTSLAWKPVWLNVTISSFFTPHPHPRTLLTHHSSFQDDSTISSQHPPRPNTNTTTYLQAHNPSLSSRKINNNSFLLIL